MHNSPGRPAPKRAIVFYAANTRVSPAPTYPTPREIEIDGEALVRITTTCELM